MDNEDWDESETKEHGRQQEDSEGSYDSSGEHDQFQKAQIQTRKVIKGLQVKLFRNGPQVESLKKWNDTIIPLLKQQLGQQTMAFGMVGADTTAKNLSSS